MLRITTLPTPRSLTFRLEGRLDGPWVAELKRCWIDALTEQGQPALPVRVDLTEVTFIDAAGKACLATMRERGARLIAGDCLIKADVQEISRMCKPRSSTNG